MTNTSGPWGSTTYNQTGTTGYTNSKGQYVELPQYTQTTQYTPGQQAIFDQTQSAQQNIAGIANDQSASLKNYLNTKFNFDNGNQFSGPSAPGQFSYGSDPFTAQDFSFNNQDAANWSTDLANQRILPQQQQDRSALETQLTNKGIRPGTAAWNSEMERLGRTQTDQNNQLALNGRSQAYNEALGTAQNNFGQAATARGINSGEQLSQYQTNLGAQQAAYQQALTGRQQNFQESITGRNQPLNEISALLSGSQIANPNNAALPTPQAQVAGVDYAGLVNNNYNQKVASSNAMLGGLFGLAGNAGGAAIGKWG